LFSLRGVVDVVVLDYSDAGGNVSGGESEDEAEASRREPKTTT
jgi:hypothetical protein